MIEDACQAHGAEYRGRRAGALGPVGSVQLLPREEPRGAGRRRSGRHQRRRRGREGPPASQPRPGRQVHAPGRRATATASTTCRPRSSRRSSRTSTSGTTRARQAATRYDELLADVAGVGRLTTIDDVLARAPPLRGPGRRPRRGARRLVDGGHRVRHPLSGPAASHARVRRSGYARGTSLSQRLSPSAASRFRCTRTCRPIRSSTWWRQLAGAVAPYARRDSRLRLKNPRQLPIQTVRASTRSLAASSWRVSCDTIRTSGLRRRSERRQRGR